MGMVLVDEKKLLELVKSVAQLTAEVQVFIEMCKQETKDKDEAVALCNNALTLMGQYKAVIEAQERTIERLKFNLITGGNRAGFSSS